MKIIKIVNWEIRVDENKDRNGAELVGIDEEGNEYRLENYVSGSLDGVNTNIICTEISEDR